MAELPISEIVDVVVNLQTLAGNQSNFNIPLVIATHNVFTSRYRVYTSDTAALSDGFTEDSPVYTMLSGIFSGDYAPTEVIVGRRALGSIVLTLEDPTAEGQEYTVSVRVGSTISVFSVDSTVDDDTAAEVASLLVTEMGTPTGYTVTDNTDGTITLEPDALTEVFAVTNSSANISEAAVADAGESATDAYTAIRAALSTDYFFLLSDTHISTEQLELAALAQSNRDMYITSSQDPLVWDSTYTTDILSQLQSNSYQNTVFTAHESADTVFPEAAIVGSWAGTNPGVTTLHAKTLRGVPVSTLDETAINAVSAKKGNTYPSIAGSGFYLDGFVPDGNFADTIRFKLWLQARVSESVFNLIRNKSNAGTRVNMNSIGFDQVEQAIAEPLKIAFNRGAITENETTGNPYEIYIPDRTDISQANRADRLLPDVRFEVIYSNAVHRVRIVGTVSI